MKLTPEIEAVARAIYETDLSPETGWEFGSNHVETKNAYRCRAIAAIRALREPTSRQIVAGLHEDLGPYDVATSYTAMIDAALGENK